MGVEELFSEFNEEEAPKASDVLREGDDAATSGIEKHVWPYRTDDQVRKAAKKFGQRNSKEPQRQKILSRLRESGEVAAAGIPDLLDVFARQEMGARHQILELIETLVKEGSDLSASAEDLARYLNDPNYALREKVTDILVTMGPAAAGASTRALGCTRHGLREVRLCGVRVLGGMGDECVAAALPRLQELLKSTAEHDTEFQEALAHSIQALQKDLVQEDGAAPEEREPESYSATWVVKMVERLATEGKDCRKATDIIHRVTTLPSETRAQGFLRCLETGGVEVRCAAARLMATQYEEFIPLAKQIMHIYERDTNLKSRGSIADLLTCIFCEVTFRPFSNRSAS